MLLYVIYYEILNIIKIDDYIVEGLIVFIDIIIHFKELLIRFNTHSNVHSMFVLKNCGLCPLTTFSAVFFAKKCLRKHLVQYLKFDQEEVFIS